MFNAPHHYGQLLQSYVGLIHLFYYRCNRVAGPEVENALFTHPALAECAMVGLLDAERGKLIKAFVVLKPEQPASDSLSKALQEHVKATLAPFKYPRQIQFVAMRARTETGKLQRFKLRQPC